MKKKKLIITIQSNGYKERYKKDNKNTIVFITKRYVLTYCLSFTMYYKT